jgi:NADH:ubiquinone oxidoreductase subunit F (NADH-binding)
LFIPPSENRQLTFDLPFIVGINGISIWRDSGQYTAKVVDETIAVVKSITRGNDFFNQESNSAVVWVTPLKSGTTKLIVTDVVTGQTSGVDVVVN